MLDKLVGLTADEDTLFETVLFELESNFDIFKSECYDIVLKQVENQKFKIEKVIWRNDSNNKPPPHSEYMRKNPWFSFEGKGKKIGLILIRIDLTVKSADIFQDGSSEVCLTGSLVDPNSPAKKMTAEEIRIGFQELCGILQDSIEVKSKPKKAI